jgi:pimeloyl-ACP methyl ester carboxylesterase
MSQLHVSRPESTRHALFRMVPLWGWTSLPFLWAIRQPTLIVAGDDDPVTPLVNHKVMAAMIPKARLHTVKGGGHMVLLDSPERVGPVVTKFLRGEDDPEPGTGRRRIPQLRS